MLERQQANNAYKPCFCPLCLELDAEEARLLRDNSLLTNMCEGSCEVHLKMAMAHRSISFPIVTRAGPCPICRALDQFARVRVEQHDPPTLCLRHLLLLRTVDRTAYMAAARARARWLREKIAHLEEYFRREDYRYRHEPRGDEQDAFLEVLAFFAGPPRMETSNITERMKCRGPSADQPRI